jgi:hypothetical protein
LPVGNVPAGNFFLARVSVYITVGVFVGEWFFLFATDLATEMGFTDDCFTDGRVPLVRPLVLFSPTDCIAVTDRINPSVKLDNVVVKEGKKNNLRRRSDHHASSRACVTSCGRGHDDASKETTKCEVWPLGGVTCTF